ncbi:unnamed protein product [Periconia digitata]|uniref:Uncharacterized protein n=1 Tax=Periconia digitata TaxID=1303443 RepID=A0A9W4XPQ4_9PLEO|nr:unnamed protein product [Periconia digitata]
MDVCTHPSPGSMVCFLSLTTSYESLSWLGSRVSAYWSLSASDWVSDLARIRVPPLKQEHYLTVQPCLYVCSSMPRCRPCNCRGNGRIPVVSGVACWSPRELFSCQMRRHERSPPPPPHPLPVTPIPPIVRFLLQYLNRGGTSW